MCGITGWVAFDTDLTHHRRTIDEMTETMILRGPDAGGTWVAEHVALGHRRLAIIDLSGGVQPMEVATPNGPVVMVYSGEAYNFMELRKDLEHRGHRFHTSSDTEVVLRAYLQWGSDVAGRLNGMFAFAVWDARDEKLVLVRDRLGVKPLFYYPTADGVLFGSEPKAILANPLARPIVDVEGMRESMGMARRPGQAIWKGMHEVEPGTVVAVDARGRRTHRYWTLRPAPHPDDRATTLETIRDLLGDIVERQLIADVPQCVLLSGGLDSSVVAALAAQQLAAAGGAVRTFSVDFVGSEDAFRPDAFRTSRDAPFVREVVERIHSTHQNVVLGASEMYDPALRRSVIVARDAPNGQADSDMSLYLLFRAIRDKSTVALSGESADESFGGYKWFHDPGSRRLPVFPWVAQLMTPQGATSAISPFRPEIMNALKLEQYMLESYSTAVKSVEHLPGATAQERQMRTLFHMHLTRFLPMLLDRKDRMSMAVGLEVRVPYCDHRLVEYVYNAPWSMQSFDGREKSLLRHAAAGLLPHSVATRLKSGYPTIQDATYVSALQQQGKEALAVPGHPVFNLVNRAWVRTLVAMDPARVAQRERGILERIIDLSIWLDVYQPELALS